MMFLRYFFVTTSSVFFFLFFFKVQSKIGVRIIHGRALYNGKYVKFFGVIFKTWKANLYTVTYIIYFFDREWAVSLESCNLIGSGSGQHFPISWPRGMVTNHTKHRVKLRIERAKFQNMTKTKNKRWQKHDFSSFSQ